MKRWVKHHCEPYARENFVVVSAIDAIEPLSIIEQLDAEPILEETCKAFDSLTSDKAPGNDGTPPDLIKI